MKALLFLFGIYLLALGCLPCADDNCVANKPVVAAAHHNSNCPNEENCPPFCTCSCCSIHINTAGIAGFALAFLPQAINAKELLPLCQAPISGMGNTIWQPPRLG